ncbi:MAG: mannose-1-phosphate guanylyltransferase [Flammeovirgaceae bacterium]|nr:mannose-1-phosphate guanylyltransferase [Flammeovirgaceae bacterium]
MDKKINIVIMAGGTGTRFWPYSRNKNPKQFLDVLNTGRSLLQMTYDRFLKYVPKDQIWIVSNLMYQKLISTQIPDLPSDQILLEPSKRNTGPCIAYAAYKIRKKDPDGLLVITPSDHAIFKLEAFLEAIKSAVACAKDNTKLLTLGIKPHRPEIGYGYIQYSPSNTIDKKVKTFTEKPDINLAKKFIETGEFVWNAGIFVWSIAAIIEAFEKYQKELAALFSAGHAYYGTEKEASFIETVYYQCKSISIDYAIMEKADNVFTILGDFGWSDLGSWDVLHDLAEKDADYNVIEQTALLYNSHSNYIKSKKEKLLVISDLEGYLVADFDDVLLICKKDDASKFKSFVNDVKATKGDNFI